MSGFARPFRVTYQDRPEVGFHGVEFPDGRVALALPFGGFAAATAFEHLELLPGAKIEWADGGLADGVGTGKTDAAGGQS